MFTLRKKKGWFPSPRATEGQIEGSSPSNPRNDRGSVLENWKGNRVVAVVETLPPPPQTFLGESSADASSSEAEVWRRFREAGLLDESVFRRKDREALVHRITELEKELHDYQYTMGLLLIEKEEWASEYKELRQGLAKAEEILKREQAAYLIAISELEKREENIRKDLVDEQQCVRDLEKALREMSAEFADAKLTSDKEKKYLEIKGMLHSADVKLAEASWKKTKIDGKLEEVEAREHRLQEECLFFTMEKRGHDEDLARQRENLQTWEQKLLEHENRLVEEHHFFNERANRTSESNSVLKKKEVLEEEEDDSIRLQDLAVKEKEVEIKQMNLEKKEKDLLALEEKVAGERVAIQKLLDDHNTTLDSKEQEGELQLEKEVKPSNEDLKDKLGAVEQKEREIKHREAQIFKREHALDSKMKKLKDKKKELNTKLRYLEKREESLHKDEKMLKDGKEQLAIDTQKMASFKTEIEESLTNETEDLSQKRKELEREQEVLDERRMALEEKQKQFNDDKKWFEEWRHIEEERLRNERLEARVDIQLLEELRLEKEALEKTLVNERSEALETVKRIQEEMEEKLQKKEEELDSRKMELYNIKSSSEFSESKILKLKADQDRLEREKELSIQRRKLETNQLEIQDIDTFRVLSRNLQNQQEESKKGRECSYLAEQCMVCKNCGVTISEIDLSLQSLKGTEVEGDVLLEEHMEGGCMSSLRKCPRLFNLSPGERAEHPTEAQALKPILFDRKASEAETENEPERTFGVANNSCDTHRAQSDSGVRDNGVRVKEGDRREPNVSSIAGQNKRGRPAGKRGRPKTIKRTYSVEAVVEDAKAILGELLEEKEQQADGRPENFVDISEESEGDSVLGDQMGASAGQKRHFGDTSESASVGGHHKRRQMSAPGTRPPGEKRYNFRRSTIDAAEESADRMKGNKRRNRSIKSKESMISRSGGGGGDGTSKHEPTDAASSRFS